MLTGNFRESGGVVARARLLTHVGRQKPDDRSFTSKPRVWVLWEGQWEAFEGMGVGMWPGEAGALEGSFQQLCGDWSRREGTGERQINWDVVFIT